MENNNKILENEAPFLSEIKRENHFNPPKNYFEVLPEIISYKKLENSNMKSMIDKLSWRILMPSATIFCLFILVFNLNRNTESYELSPAQISELIIEDDFFDFDDELIYEAYSELLKTEGETILTNEDYINYLIENDIDITSIIEEL